jgi:hypothetical protein
MVREIIAKDRHARKHGLSQNTIGEIEVTHFPVTILILGEMYRFHGITNGILLGRTALVVLS